MAIISFNDLTVLLRFHFAQPYNNINMAASLDKTIMSEGLLNDK